MNHTINELAQGSNKASSEMGSSSNVSWSKKGVDLEFLFVCFSAAVFEGLRSLYPVVIWLLILDILVALKYYYLAEGVLHLLLFI